jgi:uncharacterized integral membrane protein
VILLGALLLGFTYISIENLGETVHLSFFGHATPEMHVFVLLLAALLLGVVLGIMAMSTRVMRMRRQLKRLVRDVKALEGEVTELRDAPVVDLPETMAAIPTAGTAESS